MLPIYLELAFLLFRICKAYVGDVRRLMQSEHRELLYPRPGTMGSVQAKVGPALSGQERQFEEHPSACCCEQRLDVAGADRVAPSKQFDARSSISSSHFADAATFSRCPLVGT
jgi:hypothetical protein